ncbi:hypothetical protein [Roseisolibacter sp. H3M3-2]|uniref:hypothetical protein n=1 Tax=Roseisolibacter sp. H3M3-2 TaxID=3031323 RepID=UPI0023DA945E|nr:hypothetical protein [Roseisolibacter sp. H3M3-2]MDF1506236.1 hypothetical protein [Roseisolibacter sp. H3M3-2]
MFVVETSRLLPHPPSAVFAVAGDRRLSPRWRTRLADLAEPAHPTDADPPRHLAWSGRGAAFALDRSLALESTADGTRVTYQCALSVDEPPRLSPARATALRRLLVRRAGRDLERLAALVAQMARAEARARVTLS